MDYEYIDVYKNEKKTDKAPDYRMMTRVGEEYKEIYVGWIKETKGGTKFISFKRSKPKEPNQDESPF